MRHRRQSTELFNLIFVLLIVIFAFSGCSSNNADNPSETVSGSVSVIEKTEEIAEEVEEIHEPVIKTALIDFTGDLMVHSYQYEESYDPSTGAYEFDHNFQAVKKYFSSADYTVGNLETVLGGDEIGAQDYPCFNTPDSFAQAAKDAGFDFFTTANNHCADQGTDALIRTLDVLDSIGIKHTGTNRSQEEKDKIEITDINGIKFVFLSYTYGTNGMKYRNDYNVNMLTEENIKTDIAKAKKLNPDFIVVMPHWGNEYETHQSEEQEKWADLMFAEGADIIVASHPHVLQPMEMRTITDSDGTKRQGYVMYSMGNFISSQTTVPRNASIILNIAVKKVDDQKAQITKVSFIPIWTQFRNGNNVNDFVVRSVYDVLTDPDRTAKYRAKDLNRVNDIHYETTSLLLNKDIPIENIQEEYTFYELNENADNTEEAGLSA